MTRAECRRLLFGHRLAVWGEHMRGCYVPSGQGDGQPGAKRIYPPLPYVDWLADVTEAFATLAPDTPARGMRFSTLTRKRFNRHQRAVWLFYVDELGGLTDRDRSTVVRSNGYETAVENGGRDWAGDERVGQALGVGGRQANRLRCEAVDRLAERLAGKWDRRAA
jgi:hypothetical protein